MKISRNYITPFISLVFLTVGLSGLLMFFHLFDGFTEALHECLGLFFIICAVFHIMLNWNGLKVHFKRGVFIPAATFASTNQITMEALEKLIYEKTGLRNEHNANALNYFKPITVEKNQLLLEEGEVANKLFFIKKGCLRLYYNNGEHNLSTRFMAFDHTFLTSIGSFISRKPATENIQAVEASQLLVISHRDFSHIYSCEIPTMVSAIY